MRSELYGELGLARGLCDFADGVAAQYPAPLARCDEPEVARRTAGHRPHVELGADQLPGVGER
jgi:hypothetical protein